MNFVTFVHKYLRNRFKPVLINHGHNTYVVCLGTILAFERLVKIPNGDRVYIRKQAEEKQKSITYVKEWK